MHAQLLEGLTDAIGFLAGGLVGFALARIAGLDPLQDGYGPAALAGIGLAGLGGGLGVQAARWVSARLFPTER